MSTPASNVDRLTQAGIIDPKALSEEQLSFIDTQLTGEEVEYLIRGGQKLVEYARQHNLAGLPTVTV